MINGRILIVQSDTPRIATSPAQLKHETNSYMAKVKEKSCVIKEYVINELGKILNMVLSDNIQIKHKNI